MARIPDPTAKIALLRTATDVFAERGLEGAKVEDITRRARQSKGAFYLHFQSKEDAFRQVVEAFLARLADIYKSPKDFETLPASGAEVVRFWLERDEQMLEFLWQNRSVVTMVAGCQGQNAYLLDAFRLEVRRTCRAWVELSQKRGMMDSKLSSELVATLVCGAYDELCRQMIRSPRKPPILDWLRQTLAIFLRGLGTPTLLRALDRAHVLQARVLDAKTTSAKTPVNRSRGVAVSRRSLRPTYE